MRKFADEAGLNVSTVSKWLDTSKEDIATPDVSTLAKVADVTNVDIRTLICMVTPERCADVDVEIQIIMDKYARIDSQTQDVVRGIIDRAIQTGQKDS